jgi:hypothetical protein
MNNPYLDKILQRHKLYVGGKSPVLAVCDNVQEKPVYEGGAGSEKDLAAKIIKSLKMSISTVVERRKKVTEALKKIKPISLENGGGLILFNSKQECTSFIYFLKQGTDIGFFKIPKANLSTPEKPDATTLPKPLRYYLSDIHQIWGN